MSTPLIEAAAFARAETMLAVAEHVGVDLDGLWLLAQRLRVHEAAFDAAVSSSKRHELEQLMGRDVAELAESFKVLARAVERGGVA